MIFLNLSVSLRDLAKASLLLAPDLNLQADFGKGNLPGVPRMNPELQTNDSDFLGFPEGLTRWPQRANDEN
jgi:hypothetical protein